jgi:hypothetical protein
MARVEITLPEPVEHALRQAALDSKRRASKIIEDLIRKYLMELKPVSAGAAVVKGWEPSEEVLARARRKGYDPWLEAPPGVRKPEGWEMPPEVY